MLTLTAGLTAATINHHAAAADWLAAADELAGRGDDDIDGNWKGFSATNVAIWRISVELGESGGAVVELAGRVDETG